MVRPTLALAGQLRIPARINTGHSSVTFSGAVDRLSVTLSIRT
jgi:hypothetical protein